MTALLDEGQVSALLRGIDIPPCPDILLQLDAELRKESPDQRAMATLISRDVALAGQIMLVVNSPAFSTGRRIDSIIHAITVLGMRQMFNVVVTQLLKAALSGPQAVAMERFWEDSALNARVSTELARRLRCLKPEMAYTFGLFHDCGIPLLMRRFPNYQEVLDEASASEHESLSTVEEARLGTHHAVVGYFLARRWNLPEFVVQGILLHHDYSVLDGTTDALPEAQAAIAVNALAEHIIRLHARVGQENEWRKAAKPVGAFLGMAEQDVADVIDDMLDWVESRESVPG
ncbi:MAG: Metal-dependent phosphohydrolase, subdomain [Rhodocyclaceae bacterium]|nr:Metal-dependent phosphohydrolase, subdomain [Rhodocyclaceae bacterium]